MQVSHELLLSARLADRNKSLAAPIEWELASVIHELERCGNEYQSHLSSAACLPAREECRAAAILAAAQAAARTGKTDALEELVAYAVRCVAQWPCSKSTVMQSDMLQAMLTSLLAVDRAAQIFSCDLQNILNMGTANLQEFVR